MNGVSQKIFEQRETVEKTNELRPITSSSSSTFSTLININLIITFWNMILGRWKNDTARWRRSERTRKNRGWRGQQSCELEIFDKWKRRTEHMKMKMSVSRWRERRRTKRNKNSKTTMDLHMIYLEHEISSLETIEIARGTLTSHTRTHTRNSSHTKRFGCFFTTTDSIGF